MAVKGMTVKEAIEDLRRLPADLIVGDEYSESLLTGFSVSSYDDDEGEHDYVVIETVDWPEDDD